MSETTVLAAVEDYTPLSVQSSAEASGGTNTTANLLYSAATETQGNFSTFYTRAVEVYTDDIAGLGITPSISEEDHLKALLIWHFYQLKFPGISASSIKQGNDQITKKPGVTDAKLIYDELLSEISTMTVSTSMEEMDDSAEYDDKFKPTTLEMPAFSSY